MQGAGLSAQGAGRPSSCEPEPGAESDPQPQRGSAEPGGAEQPGGHTGSAASTRGGEENIHTITLSFVLPCHLVLYCPLQCLTQEFLTFISLFVWPKQVAIFITDPPKWMTC